MTTAAVKRRSASSLLSAIGAPLAYPIWDVTSSGLNQTKKWGNERNRSRVGGMFTEENFGMIRIDWTPSDPVIKLEVRDGEGSALMLQDVRLSELRAE